jgi:hypothetical protein
MTFNEPSMNLRTLVFLTTLAAAGANAADADVEAGMAAVESLGRINGLALACSDQAVASRAKELMLKYAPRTSSYGSAYEQATQRGFMDQVKNHGGCPAAAQLEARIDAVATELGKKLPAVE